RTELAHGIFGSIPIGSGSYSIGDRLFQATTPKESINYGIGFLTEDRKNEGLVLGQSILANITMPTLSEFVRKGFIDFHSERNTCEEEVDKFGISARNVDARVNNLSGGNQQKVLFSRWSRTCKGILILDEPTNKIVRDLANDGVAILLISSELPEIVGMCDRVLVMREGWITGELEGNDIREESLMHLATLSRTE
ncbi:MAG: sugar ABC transporter ATP-binding protein, partial [Deltaproteobacteria bacterium]|nr:sugar ABC transporter ATP-binding protein [Deltaproteobacteria bacterium]